MNAVLNQRARDHEYAVEWLRRFTTDQVDAWTDVVVELLHSADIHCGKKLAAGRRDVFCSVADLRPVWEHCLEPWNEAEWTSGIRDEMFAITLSKLAEQGEILFVSDRQRVRSRTFETVHYLRNLRQRLDDASAISDAPGLVEMVKAETIRRLRPQRSFSLDDLSNAINDVLYTGDELQIREDIDTFDQIAETALEVFRSAVTKVFSAKALFSGFQVRATRELLRAALGQEEASSALAIAAGTGFGKTEAFAFAVLYYAVLARIANALAEVEGASALLLYPRRDLCDDQASRLSAYLVTINRELESVWGDIVPAGQPFRPLRLALAHGGFDVQRVACPLCNDERRSGGSWTATDEQQAWLVADPNVRSSQTARDFRQLFRCQRKPVEHRSAASTLAWQVNADSDEADIVVSTIDTMHRRMMDRHGIQRLFGKRMQPPRFIVLDEMHIYEGQTGAHAAQIVRRLRQRIRSMRRSGVEPVVVGASATIAEPTVLLSRLSGIPRDRIGLQRPQEDEVASQGIEYSLFVQSPGNRLVDPHVGDLDDSNAQTTAAAPLRFVSEQASMIQAAMCLQHTMKTHAGVAPQKRRVLGFVDSLDVSARLARNLDNAEWHDAGPGAIGRGTQRMNRPPLFALRLPSGIPGATTALRTAIAATAQESAPNSGPLGLTFNDPGRDCPRLSKGVECHQPPHHLIEPCIRYERGECWYSMARPAEEGLWPLIIQTHQSGRRAWAFPGRRHDPVADKDNWRLLVTTSALEVGFDHRELIATWQYHAPPSVAAYLQRKGRGGRDAGDSPITMMVLGTSGSDVFAFQHHGRFVAVDHRDLTCWVDPENPSVRTQHLVAAIFDFCAATNNQRAYSMLEFSVLADTLRNRRNDLITWLSDAFAISHAESSLVAEQVSKAVREVWNVPLNLPAELGLGTLTPVSLFQTKKSSELKLILSALSMSPDQAAFQEARTWLVSLARTRGEGAVTAPDFFAGLPDDFVENPDLRVPQATIPQPLGRQIRVLDGNGQYLDAEPAEFVLRSFLPGGFKIRYNGRLWMAPWKAQRDVPTGSNLSWASLDIDEPGSRQIVSPDIELSRPRQPLSGFLASNTQLAPERQQELLSILGSNATLASVGSVRLRDIGSAISRQFFLDETKLRIVRTAAEAGPRNTLLARDPHITPRNVTIPLPPKKSDTRPTVAPFRRLQFHAQQPLAILHYANLVHCYPAASASERTLVVRFCSSDAPTQPFCPGALVRTQAVEFGISSDQIPPLAQPSAARVFWKRVRESLVTELVLRTAALSSVYLIEDSVDGLKALEPSAGAFFQSQPSPVELGRQIDQASGWLRDLAPLRPHVDTVATVLADAAEWTTSSGRGRAFSETVAAAITRRAADELNLSPNAFRRLVEPFADGWKILLFDDNEGGSGNCRRLWDLMGGWSEFAQMLRAAAHCRIEDADEAVARALASGRSPESLSVLRNESRLAEVVRFDGDAASLLRLDRTFENAEIAAFNLYAFSELSELQRRYGGTPPLKRFVQQIVNTFALDPRAEFLRRQFIENKIGGISELPSRLRAVMRFCEGSCPYCLGGISDEDYSDRRLIESL